MYEEIDGIVGRDPFAAEMGLAGWTVSLYDANDVLLQTKTTLGDGTFVFETLANGTYSVCLTGQAGYVQTDPVGGTGCGGAGYKFTIQGTLETWVPNNNFGVMAL